MDKVDNITRIISQIIVDALAQGDQIALPSFGNFSVVKIDEHIEVDRETNARILMPPSIKAHFTPALKLTKELAR